MKNKTLMCLCEGAVMIALAVVLSYLKFKIWANGGSVDLVMIPLIAFALRRGGLWGIGAGIIFGTIKYFLGGTAYGWQAIIMDYSLAYGMVGLAGFFGNHPVIGTVAASVMRFIVHLLSGVFVWAWMPEEFVNIWVYSAAYNLSYMLPNAAIAIAAVAVLSRKSELLLPQKSKA